MTFTDCSEAQDIPASALGGSGLVRVANYARIEQGRCFEGIFVKKIGTNKLALYFAEGDMRRQGFFHFGGSLLEYLQQVSVPAIEIFEHIGQLTCCGLGIEPENPVDDMVCTCLVGRIEVPRLGCRLERPHDDPGGIRAQIRACRFKNMGMAAPCCHHMRIDRSGRASVILIWSDSRHENSLFPQNLMDR